MQVKYDFRNGQRYLLILPRTNDEEEFISDFFNSPDDVNEKLTLKAQGKFSELNLSKKM